MSEAAPPAAVPEGGAERQPRGRVLKAILNYGAGSYVPQIVNFLLLPLYSRYLEPAEMGTVEICTGIQAMVMIVTRLGVPGSVTRFYFDTGEGPELRDLVTTCAVAVMAVSAIALAIGLTAGPWIFALVMPGVPFHPYMDLALIGAFFLAAPDLQRRLLQAREQSAFSAKLSVANGATTTVLTVFFVLGIRLGGVGVMLAGAISGAIFAAVAAYNHRRDLRGRFRWDRLRDALGYGAPLVPHHIAAWAHRFVGSWVLTVVTTVASVGQLALATRVASPLTVLTGAFANAYSPVYFSWRTKLGPEVAAAEAKRMGRLVVAVGTICVVGAATVGGLVIRHVMADTYREAHTVVGVVAAALFLHLVYTHVSVEVFYAKNTKWISIIFAASSVVNLVAVFVVGRWWGALGAAIAQALGGLVSVLMVIRMTRGSAPVPLDATSCVAGAIASAAACVYPFFLPAELPWTVDTALSIAVCVGLGGVALLLMARGRSLRESVRTLRGRRT